MTARTKALAAARANTRNKQSRTIAVSSASSDLSELSDIEENVDQDLSNDEEESFDRENVGLDDVYNVAEDLQDDSGSDYGQGLADPPKGGRKRGAKAEKSIKGPRNKSYHCFDRLSTELFSAIFNQLDDKSIHSLSATCRRLHNLISSTLVRSAYFFENFAMDEVFYRLAYRPALFTPDLIDAVHARRPISRYAIQMLHLAKAGSGPGWLGKSWGINIRLSSLSHLYQLAGKEYGDGISLHKDHHDGKIVSVWLQTDGKATDTALKTRWHRRRASRNIATASDLEYARMTEIFTAYNLKLFCPSDPLHIELVDAIKLNAGFLELLCDAGFRVSPSFSRKALTNVLFGDTKTTKEKVAIFTTYAVSGVRFTPQILNELYGTGPFQVSGLTWREQRRLASKVRSTCHTAIACLKDLDALDLLEGSLTEIAADMIVRKTIFDTLFDAAFISNLARQLPSIVEVDRASCSVLHALLFLSLPNSTVRNIIDSYGSYAQRIDDTETEPTTPIEDALVQTGLIYDADMLIELAQHGHLPTNKIAELFLGLDNASKAQKLLFTTAVIDTPGTVSFSLSNAIKVLFDHGYKEFIRSVILARNIKPSQNDGKTAIGYRQTGLPEHRQYMFEERRGMCFETRYVAHGSAESLAFGSRSPQLLSPAQSFGANGQYLQTIFLNDAEVTSIIFKHAICSQNKELIMSCLNSGCRLSVEHFLLPNVSRGLLHVLHWLPFAETFADAEEILDDEHHGNLRKDCIATNGNVSFDRCRVTDCVVGWADCRQWYDALLQLYRKSKTAIAKKGSLQCDRRPYGNQELAKWLSTAGTLLNEDIDDDLCPDYPSPQIVDSSEDESVY